MYEMLVLKIIRTIEMEIPDEFKSTNFFELILVIEWERKISYNGVGSLR